MKSLMAGMKRARIILENRRTRSLYLTAILLLLVVLGTGYLAMPAGSRRQGEVYVRVTAGAGAAPSAVIWRKTARSFRISFYFMD